MKKVTLLVLTLCLLVAGCGPVVSSEQTSSQEVSSFTQSVTQPVEWSAPSALLITNPYYFAGQSNKYRTEWEKQLADSGSTITVDSLDAKRGYPDGYDSYEDYLLTAPQLTGLCYVDDYLTLAKLVAAGRVTAVDPYLVGNEIWDSLPAQFRQALQIGGSTWAIPASGYYTAPSVTYYNTEVYADTLGVSSLTADEFTAVLTAAAKNGQPGIYSVDADSLRWLFEQYGLPTTAEGKNILYSEKYGCVVDSMLLDGAADALLEARRLYLAGAINEDLSSLAYAEQGGAEYMRQLRSEAESAGKPGVFSAVSASEAYTASLLLTADQQITAYGGCYCLITGSAEPGESVNALLELLWGGDENHRMMSVGAAAAGDESLRSPNLCGDMYGVTYNDEFIDSGIESGRFTVTDYRLTMIISDTYSANKAAIDTAYAQLLDSAITDMSVTVKQALETYKATMAALGGNDILSRANAAFSLTAIQSYT